MSTTNQSLKSPGSNLEGMLRLTLAEQKKPGSEIVEMALDAFKNIQPQRVLGSPFHFLLYPDAHRFFVYNGNELEEVHLRPFEFGIAKYLMENSNRLLTHKEIFSNVWGGESETYLGSVKGHINGLRKKLGKHASLIETIWGYGNYRGGYRYDAPSITTNKVPPEVNLNSPSTDLILDPNNRRVFKGEEEIPLTPTEFELLRVLRDNRGGVVPYRILSAYTHSGTPDSVKFLIMSLRAKLGDDPKNATYIVNRRDVGYMLL